MQDTVSPLCVPLEFGAVVLSLSFSPCGRNLLAVVLNNHNHNQHPPAPSSSSSSYHLILWPLGHLISGGGLMSTGGGGGGTGTGMGGGRKKERVSQTFLLHWQCPFTHWVFLRESL